MKTENKNMRIKEPAKTAGKQAQEEPKYKSVDPVMLDAMPEDVAFIRSTDVCKLLNISNSTLRNLRAEHAIPFYKLGGTFLYSNNELSRFQLQQKNLNDHGKNRIIILPGGNRPLPGYQGETPEEAVRL